MIRLIQSISFPKNRMIILILFLVFCFLQSEAQIFPLKISTNGRYLITKKGSPFLLNAFSIALILESPENLAAKVNRIKALGYNTIYISFSNITIKKDLQKVNSQKTLLLKKIIREAEFNELAVMISLSDNLTTEETIFIFEKLKKFKNVLWLLNHGVLNSERSNFILHHKQLIGYTKNSNGSNVFRVIQTNESIPSPLSIPTFLIVRTDSAVNDSAAFAYRKNIYSGILNGISGIIQDQPFKDNNLRHLYNLYSFDQKRIKNIFDTLQWNNFVFSTSLFESDILFKKSAILGDSSQAVIYYIGKENLPLNLSMFHTELHLTWINLSTGLVLHSAFRPEPAHQIFMPPLDARKYKDWLLIFKAKQK